MLTWYNVVSDDADLSRFSALNQVILNSAAMVTGFHVTLDAAEAVACAPVIHLSFRQHGWGAGSSWAFRYYDVIGATLRLD